MAGLKRREPGKSQWHKVCDPHLLEHLLVGEAKTAQKRIYSGLLLMLSLTTLALAGPTWERLPQPLFRAACGRVIVLDLSLSMNAPDITPSRLSRARYKAIDLIKSGIGIEQGLVVFAGDSFIVAPLTDDRATLLNLLPGLDSNTVPVQGSRADRGLEEAGKLLKRAAINQGQIILLTDDADPQTIAVAKKLHRDGHRVDVIAVGTKKGAPVSLNDGSYLKDDQGRIVVPVPDFAKLREVADSGGGNYLEIEASESSFKRLNQAPELSPENKSKSELTGDQWLDRGPWLLLPLILIAALCFRKGWLLIILMALFVNVDTASAQSFDQLWGNLWQRPNQQAAKAFAQKDFKGAAGLTNDPDWQAAANYRAGNFKEAAAALEALSSSRAHYNRGNALAHAGKLEEALQAYEQALKADPDLADAKFNHDLVEKLLQQNQQKSQNDDSKQDNQKKKEPNNQKSKDKSKDQQQSEPSQDASEQKDQQDNQQKSQNEQNKQNEQKAENQKQKSQAQNQEQQEAQKKPAAETEKSEESPNQTQEKSQPDSGEKKDKKDPEGLAAQEENDEKPMNAKQQALEQWLRRVPDDPQGLLQKKFLYQYRDREDRSQGHKEW